MKRELNWTPPSGTKIVWPTLHVFDAAFTPTRGADVQATWRKRGWEPVFGNSPKVEEPQHKSKVLKLWKQS
jgi:hypothetical protein